MNEEARKKLIQLIHIGKGKLSLSDDEYRLILSSCSSGKESCADMHLGELKNVLAALKKAGFMVEGTTRFGGRKKMPVKSDNVGRASEEQIYYIKGLWELCARVKTEGALRAFVKRIAHVDDLRFLTVRGAQNVTNAVRSMASAAGFDPDSAIPKGAV